MRLTDLDPGWVSSGGPGITDATGQPVPERRGIGIAFDCPCHCASRCFVGFENPMDGGIPYDASNPLWHRTGETFETLTLTPSILRSKERGGCGWHGFVTDGSVLTV
jgi:hypothetical protein